MRIKSKVLSLILFVSFSTLLSGAEADTDAPDQDVVLSLSDFAQMPESSSAANGADRRTAERAEKAFDKAMLEQDVRKRLSSLLGVITAHPKSPHATEACFQVGLFAFMAAEYDLALEACEAYLARRPNAAQRDEAQARIAECLRNLERYPEAMERYMALLQKPANDETSAKISGAIASCMMAMGRYDESTGILQASLSEFPAYAQAQGMMLNLALCLEEQGQLPQARKTYAALKLQYPKTAEAELASMRLDDLSLPLLGARARLSRSASSMAPAPFASGKPLLKSIKSAPSGNFPAAAFPDGGSAPKILKPNVYKKSPAAFPTDNRRTQPEETKKKASPKSPPLAAFPD